jgi:energy-converting hydrogenase A subunit M
LLLDISSCYQLYANAKLAKGKTLGEKKPWLKKSGLKFK